VSNTWAQPDSLISALTKARIPVANHQFIGRFAAAANIAGYHLVERSDKPYVIARRSDGLPDLHIHYGYTTGFTSEDDVVQCAGTEAKRGPSSSRKTTWYVAHPVNRVRPDGATSRHTGRPSAGICSCGMELPVTGVCGSCA